MAIDHMQAVQSGEVTGSNINGLKKALNADYRRKRFPWASDSVTAPKLREAALDAIIWAIVERQPLIVGLFHETGMTVIDNPRWRDRFRHVEHKRATVDSFRLVDFMTHDSGNHYPVIEACGPNGSFRFINIPWQAGGNGPEIWGY